MRIGGLKSEVENSPWKIGIEERERSGRRIVEVRQQDVWKKRIERRLAGPEGCQEWRGRETRGTSLACRRQCNRSLVKAR